MVLPYTSFQTLSIGCLENFSRGSRCYRFKVYPIAEPLNPLGQSINHIKPPPFVEVYLITG